MKMRARWTMAAGLTLGLWAGVAAAQDAPQISESTADHTSFEALNKEFTSGPEVTRACLSCHTEASHQVKQSIHWTWDYTHPETGQKLGKKRVIDSFCVNCVSNEALCTACHAGYGWTDMTTAPPAEPDRVDCLICHDQSGQYTKKMGAAGHPPLTEGGKSITGQTPAPAVNLTEAAQSIGLPGRDNCGQCHFYGGGGDNVKHGDLSSAMYDPELSVDVHMSPEGEDFACSTCHVSDRHVFAGSRYNVTATYPEGTGKPGARRDVATCESCHGTAPHPTGIEGLKLNDHVDTVACQSCHIPEFARGGVATKVHWDWAQAGRLGEDGKPFVEADYVQGNGTKRPTYDSKKGAFQWDENVVPYYAWFDGQVEYTTSDRTIDPSGTIEINHLSGAPHSADSRIWPFKRMEGRQPYDSGTNRLVYLNLWGKEMDESAYWKYFDWDLAIEGGMSAAGAEYSGDHGFVDTYMYWPITHMVAPAEDAVSCAECHSSDGRMANLAGIYLPGRTPLTWGGMLGLLMVIGAAGAVALHTAMRVLRR